MAEVEPSIKELPLSVYNIRNVNYMRPTYLSTYLSIDLSAYLSIYLLFLVAIVLSRSVIVTFSAH